jgi:hypothetical protein
MCMTSNSAHLVPAGVLSHLSEPVHEHDVVNHELIADKLDSGESHNTVHILLPDKSSLRQPLLEPLNKPNIVVSV